jgi:regulatory protein YycI of two-component signal transduction system YycFG
LETILIWIVLFLLAGIFLAVKEKFSSERVTTAKNEVLDQTVEPRTEKKESKEIHGDSTENVVQSDLPPIALPLIISDSRPVEAWA